VKKKRTTRSCRNREGLERGVLALFHLKEWQDGWLKVYEFFDDIGTAARFVPERGGILTEFALEGIPVFYLDRDTLHDPGKNIRGGNPVLFPVCGPLEEGRYTLEDRRQFEMKQHGLARNLPWTVTEARCEEEKAVLKMRLESSEETKRAYPFDFSLDFTYIVERGAITVRQKYYNGSPGQMPFYAGLHPYFLTRGDKAVSLHIPAEGCYDIISGQKADINGIPGFKAEPETNLIFFGLKSDQAWFKRSDGLRVTVRYDRSFKYIVLWTLQDRDFLCIEPWMGSNFDMNRGNARLLGPGEELSAEVSYLFEQLP
jgi:galactose mutarotase-like enzyme